MCINLKVSSLSSNMDLDSLVFANTLKLNPNTLIEISGPGQSGKSLLLQNLLTRCVCHNLNEEVLFINLSHKINSESLAKLIKSSLKDAANEELIGKCLNAVQVINCFNSQELQEALERAKYLLMGYSKIKMIFLDTLTEFYWLDLEQRTEKMTKFKYYAHYVACLEEICKESHISAIWTVDKSFLPDADRSDMALKIDYKLELSRTTEGGHRLNGRDISFQNGGVNLKED